MIGPHEQLARKQLTASRLNWLVDVPQQFACHAQIRYNSAAAPAIATLAAPDQLEIHFDAPTHGVAPGQAVVCYDGDRVLGGGWIDSAS